MALAVAQRYGGHGGYGGGPIHGGYSAPAPAYGGGHDDHVSFTPFFKTYHALLSLT